MDIKKETLTMLRNAEKIYVIMSVYTKMPYVICDSETYDDEVLLFFREEDAKAEAVCLNESGNPVQIAVVEKDSLLSFYTSLYTIGVNCMIVNRETPG